MSEYEKILIKTIDRAEFIIRKLIDIDRANVSESLKFDAYTEAYNFIESIKLIKRGE